MIIPIGDQPNPRGTPWVNYALIVANVAVFMLVTLPRLYSFPDPTDPATQEYLRQLISRFPGADPAEVAVVALRHLSAYDIFLSRWGYRPAEPSVLALLASMFLHGGWLHLLGNMLFLWIYGDNVEHRLGRLGYLLAYLLTGAFAAVVYGFFVPAAAGQTPMVGASGAISGVLGFYFVWFPRNKVRLLVLLFPFFVFTWLVSARLVLGFFLVIENLLPFLLTSSSNQGGVAYGAHIGGFVTGVIAAVMMNSLQGWRGRRRMTGGAFPRAGDTDVPTPESVAQLVDEGDPLEAVPHYFALLPSERARIPAAVVAEMGDGLAAAGRADDALAIYRQGIGDHPRGPGLAPLFLGIGLVLLRAKRRPAAAYQYLLDVLDADPSPEVEKEARAALAEIERLQKWQLRERRRW